MMRLQLKIIDLLSKNLERSFTINEIAKLLNESYSFVNRVVSKLIKDKVISREKVGHSLHCTLNMNDKAKALLHLNEVTRKEEFYAKNKEIALVLEDFLAQLKEKIKENLLFAVIFGSYAKGTATKESDIDVLVVCKKKFDIAGIIKEIHAKYGKEIAPVFVTPAELERQKEKPLIKETVKYHYVLHGFEQFINLMYK